MKSISIKQKKRQTIIEQTLGTSNYDTLISILETTPPTSIDRDLVQISLIASQLQRLEFFSHIPSIDIENLARHIQYRHMREHQVILREGDEGKAFYVLLKGRAAVYKLKAKTIVVAKDVTVAEDGVDENKNNNGNDNNNNDKGKDKNTNNDNDDASTTATNTLNNQQQQHQQEQQQQQQQQQQQGPGSAWLQKNNQRAARKDELELQKIHGGFLTALTDDDTFGEVAMMPGGNRKRKHLRTATVVATSSNGCDLIVIHQEDFQQFIAPHGSGATFFAWKRCRDILNIDSKARSDVEVNLLCDFVSNISFFAQLSTPLRSKLCRCARLRTMRKNQNIFLEGESGTEFFIILDGEVLVIKKNEKEVVEKDNEEENANELFSILHEDDREDEKKDTFGNNDEKVVARLCKGDAFGEQALLTGDPRSAITRAHEKSVVELMVIAEDDYRRILEPLMSWSKNRFSQTSMLATNISTSLGILATKPSARTDVHIAQLRFFLDQLPFFKQLPSKLIDRLCHVVSLKTKSKHEVVCHQGDEGDEFYVILQGSVSIHIVQDEQKQNVLKAKRRWAKNQNGNGFSMNKMRRRNSNVKNRSTSRNGIINRDTNEFNRKSRSNKTAKSKRRQLLKQARRESTKNMLTETTETTRTTETTETTETTSPTSPILPSRPTNSMFKQVDENNSDDDEMNNENDPDNNDAEPQTIYDLLEDHGKAVATLLAGDSFGEGAIVSNKTRLATVICREDSSFMVISKQDYLAIASLGLVFDPSQCRELLNKEPTKRTSSEIERLVRFVRPIPFFQQLDRDVSRKLCSCMTLLKAKQRQVVVLQGDEVDKHGGCFYILLRGTVSVHVIDGKVHPDSTGLRLLMDDRPRDGHTHKEGYLQHLTKRAQENHFGDEDTKNTKNRGRKGSTIIEMLDEVGRNETNQEKDPLAFEQPVPIQRLNDLDRVLGKCVTMLHAGDSFGELGLHEHHDHDGLDHANEKDARHIMNPEAHSIKTDSTKGHKKKYKPQTDITSSTHLGNSSLGSSSSPSKMSKVEKQKLLALQMVGRRNASIVCREDCELLIVRRSDFLNVLSTQKVHFNPSSARRVMEKPKEKRTPNDLQVIVELCESLTFFAQFPMHLISKCSECLTLHTYKPGDIVFEQGTPGDALFITLSGYLELDVASGTDETSEHHDDEPMSEAHAERVRKSIETDELFFRRHLQTKVLTKYKQQISSWCKRAKESVEHAVLLGELPSKKSKADEEDDEAVKLVESARHLLGHQHEKSNGTKEKHLSKSRTSASWSGTKIGRKSYGSAVCIFKAGDAFGETSLVTSNPRGGTILCIRESAELLRLDKKDFNAILRSMSDKVDFQSSSTREVIVRAKKKNFDLLGSVRIIRNVTRGIAEFETMNADELHSLFEQISVRYYNSGEEIYSRYSKGRECYMLIDGSVSMLDSNGETLHEIVERGQSFGMYSLLEHQTRPLSVICDHDEGCICLVISDNVYHEKWKGKMDRKYSNIIEILKKSKSLGPKIDAKELDLLASFAVPVTLPRGAVLRWPESNHQSQQEQHHNHNSVFYMVTGECELRTQNKFQSSTSSSIEERSNYDSIINTARPPSSSKGTRPTSARTKRGMLSTRVEEIGPSSLVGAGMILGEIYSNHHHDTNDGRSTSHSHHHHHQSTAVFDTNTYSLKCTRPTLLLRLSTRHLHHCLKTDTLNHLRLSTTSHLEWLQSQTACKDKTQQMQANDKRARLPTSKVMPGMSNAEREAHEGILRAKQFQKKAQEAKDKVFKMELGMGVSGGYTKLGRSAKSGRSRRSGRPSSAASNSARSQSPFEDIDSEDNIDNGDNTTDRRAYNLFAEQDTRVTAMRVMAKVDKILNGNKRNGISHNTDSINSTTLSISPIRTNPKIPKHSLKKRWSNMKVALNNAEKSSKALNRKRKKTEKKLRKSEIYAKQILARHAATVNGDVYAMNSEMIPMRTKLIKDPASEGGRLLSLGAHRNDYLGNIFAQLGRSGIVDRSRSESRSTSTTSIMSASVTSMTTSTSTRKKKKRKKKKKSKIGKVQNAIDRREPNRKSRLKTQPMQMFDSLNYNRFV